MKDPKHLFEIEQLAVVVDYMLEVSMGNTPIIPFFPGHFRQEIIGGKDKGIHSESEGKKMVSIGQCVKKLWTVECDHERGRGESICPSLSASSL